MKDPAHKFVDLKHGNQHIYPRPFHLIQFVLQPVVAARTRNDGEAKLIASFNPIRFHAAILPC